MTTIQSSQTNQVKATLLIASSMISLGTAALAPALPAISSEYQAAGNAALISRLVLSLPALIIAITAPFAGYIVDNFGRKKVLASSLLLLGLAGLSGYLAPSAAILLAGRALVGIGVSGLMISTTTLVADYYAGGERSTVMGQQAAVIGFSGTVLILIVGFLVDIDWRLAFLTYVLPLFILPFVLAYLYEPRHDQRCADNPPPVGEPGTCVGESIASKRLEAGPDLEAKPVPMKLIIFIYAMIFLVEIIYFVIPIQLPFYLEELTGASGARSGLAIATLSLAFSVTSMFYGRTAARLDQITILVITFFLTGISYGFIAQAQNTIALYIGMIGVGVGMGLMVPNLYVWLANEVPVDIRGRAMGGFTTAMFMGQFLSPLVSQPVLKGFSTQIAFLLAGAVLVIVVPLLFATRSRLRHLAAEPAAS